MATRRLVFPIESYVGGSMGNTLYFVSVQTYVSFRFVELMCILFLLASSEWPSDCLKSIQKLFFFDFSQIVLPCCELFTLEGGGLPLPDR